MRQKQQRTLHLHQDVLEVSALLEEKQSMHIQSVNSVSQFDFLCYFKTSPLCATKPYASILAQATYILGCKTIKDRAWGCGHCVVVVGNDTPDEIK